MFVCVCHVCVGVSVYLYVVCERFCICIATFIQWCVCYASVQCMCTFRVPDWGHNVLNPWRHDTCTESLVHKFA